MILGVLVLVPSKHASLDFVFTERINNSGFSSGMYWFYVLPLGFLLTQYTITGFDASAHMAEETQQASRTAAVGMYMSVVVSVIFGFILLVAVTFAVPSTKGVL